MFVVLFAAMLRYYNQRVRLNITVIKLNAASTMTRPIIRKRNISQRDGCADRFARVNVLPSVIIKEYFRVSSAAVSHALKVSYAGRAQP